MWCTSTPRQTRIRSSRPRNSPPPLPPLRQRPRGHSGRRPHHYCLASGQRRNPTTNVIKVINNWVGEAAKELKIRLSNVNRGRMLEVPVFPVELLLLAELGQATDNITIEGYATVKANTRDNNGAGIGGGAGAKGSNITIQGHANVTANGGWSGAGIGGGGRGAGEDGCGGDAENITIQDDAKVTATAHDGAAIGSGSPRNSLLYAQEKEGRWRK